MKRKILSVIISVIICSCLLLAACSEKEQAAEGVKIQEAECEATDEMENKFVDSTVSSAISRKEVLLTCKISEDEARSQRGGDSEQNQSNESFCIVLRNGNVYCANLYANSIHERETQAFFSEEMLPYLQDIRLIGTVSDDEINMIEKYVKQIDFYNTYSDYAVWRSPSEDLTEPDRYLAVYREKSEVVLWRPKYETPSLYGGGVRRDGMEYLNRTFSEEIIQWFLDSEFYEKWDTYTKETGTNKDPIIESAYVTTVVVPMTDNYPENGNIKISTEEELEYSEINIGMNRDVFCREIDQISENYPLENYDYILKISTRDMGEVSNSDWIQHASSLRYNKDFMYFYYDHYRQEKRTCNGALNMWIPGTEEARIWGYVDIAVVAKDSIEKEGLPELQKPQELEIFTIEDPDEKLIIVE